MNGFFGIDTDAGIGTILSNFSSEYIDHVISDSLNMKFRPFEGAMPNMVDVLERQFLAVLANSPDYKDNVSNVQEETYKEIIYKICNFYNLTFTGDFENMTITQIHGIARTLYDIFISRFTEYMIRFFTSYIVNNADSIVSYLKDDENSIKPKETGLYSPKNYIEPKFILIHANINKVIYNLAAYDISLDTLLRYFVGPVVAQKLSSLLMDNDNIYKTHYASYILDQRYSANVLTSIKLQLQSSTQEAINLIG